MLLISEKKIFTETWFYSSEQFLRLPSVGPKLLYGVNDGAKKQRQGARGLPKGAILHHEGVTQTWPGRFGQGRGLCPAAQLANLHFLSQPLTQRGAPSHS